MKHGGDLWADQQTVIVSVYPHLEGDSDTVQQGPGDMGVLEIWIWVRMPKTMPL
jgi:hypothetical protein